MTYSGENPFHRSEHASLTYNNYGRLLVFKLGGDAELPVPDLRDREIPARDVAAIEHGGVQRGERLYNENCAVCHGFLVRSGARFLIFAA